MGSQLQSNGPAGWKLNMQVDNQLEQKSRISSGNLLVCSFPTMDLYIDESRGLNKYAILKISLTSTLHLALLTPSSTSPQAKEEERRRKIESAISSP
jgi:hypothetical protein